MTLFSHRQGYKPTKLIQVESMDTDLRNSLWNLLHGIYWTRGHLGYRLDFPSNKELGTLCIALWLRYFKWPIDDMPVLWNSNFTRIKEYFLSCEWNEAYDFIEFVADNHPDTGKNREFMSHCNVVLEREVSGYRFVGGIISPVTSEEELREIEEALDRKQSPEMVVTHLRTALNMLSDRESPDYRNSIKGDYILDNRLNLCYS